MPGLVRGLQADGNRDNAEGTVPHNDPLILSFQQQDEAAAPRSLVDVGLPAGRPCLGLRPMEHQRFFLLVQVELLDFVEGVLVRRSAKLGMCHLRGTRQSKKMSGRTSRQIHSSKSIRNRLRVQRAKGECSQILQTMYAQIRAIFQHKTSGLARQSNFMLSRLIYLLFSLLRALPQSLVFSWTSRTSRPALRMSSSS